MHVIEGNLVVPEGARFGLVATRFNHFIVDRLVEGANDALLRHGAKSDAIMLVRVPGAWELPFAVRRLASLKEGRCRHRPRSRHQGGNSHFEYIATETAKGIAAAAAASAIPVVFGVLTTDTIDQAVERAGAKAGNKGWDAAVGAIEMVALEHARSIAKDSRSMGARHSGREAALQMLLQLELSGAIRRRPSHSSGEISAPSGFRVAGIRGRARARHVPDSRRARCPDCHHIDSLAPRAHGSS